MTQVAILRLTHIKLLLFIYNAEWIKLWHILLLSAVYSHARLASSGTFFHEHNNHKSCGDNVLNLYGGQQSCLLFVNITYSYIIETKNILVIVIPYRSFRSQKW